MVAAPGAFGSWSAALKRFAIIVAVVLLALRACAWMLRPRHGAALKVYCAAGIKNPAEAVAAAYQQEYGIRVEPEYGGTASLLTQIRISRTGDLFIAADDAAIQEARKQGLLREVLPLVRQTPVIAVAKGNPKAIRALDDLLRDSVRFAMANPESAGIGRVTRRLLGIRWPTFSSRVTVLKPTVMDIAGDVQLGTVDAAIVWDSAAAQFPTLEAVSVPEFANAVEIASVAVLADSTQPAAALRFARYLTAADKGGPIFRSKGFKPATQGAQ